MPEPDLHAVVRVGPVGRAVVDELVAPGLRVRTVDHSPVADLPAGGELVMVDVTDADSARGSDGHQSPRSELGSGDEGGVGTAYRIPSELAHTSLPRSPRITKRRMRHKKQPS